ncbi:peptidoglycan DD-metalloendopeptidase family protein [Candidatus Kaiserbacteria bacterium]|nr:MAG: peptidoglycan DD-metalloendopeptidase family protein [Candidatus Kaiserbacteria bacterium]
MRKPSFIAFFNSVCVHLLMVSVLFSVSLPITHAATEAEVLQTEINERNSRLKEIEQEIAGYQTELKKVGGTKNTLQKAISSLELERKKVQSDIKYTQNKIGATDLEIDKLALEIDVTEASITLNQRAVSETIQMLSETDDRSFIEVLLEYDNVSEFWGRIDELEQMRLVMREKLTDLSAEKELLSGQFATQTHKREQLLGLKEQYSDQNEVLVDNSTQKSRLLSATKNKEVEYQKLLKAKKTEYDAVLKEMRDFESKLQFILDPNTIPARGTQVFNWPVSNVVITQLFGGTEFAKQNASVYGGRAYHPGVDFGVPTGSKIMAPLSGTVRATGNTDAVPGCYSWGKWTLVDHANGLSTLYAHQSVISVVPGQQVATGEIIGYSGNTGYSTGPHLHFTVYAKAGVSVRKFNEIKAVTSCGAATTPVAASDAYIDPMVYLPQ